MINLNRQSEPSFCDRQILINKLSQESLPQPLENMGYAKNLTAKAMKVEFIDLAPGPRVLSQNAKFSLGLRITENDALVTGIRKEIKVFAQVQGQSLLKFQRRVTLQQAPENSLCNVIVKDIKLDQIPEDASFMPEIQCRFRVEIPLPRTRKEAFSEMFRLVLSSKNARLYQDISDSEILNEIHNDHHMTPRRAVRQRVATHENDFGKNDDDTEWNFLDHDQDLLDWALGC